MVNRGNGTSNPFSGDFGADGKPPFVYTGPPILSSWAIVSLIFALISPLVVCVCGLSVVTSFVAIVAGHTSLVSIRRSAGQLTGRGIALVGLIGGYFMFVVSLALVAYLIPAIQESRSEPASGLAKVDQAVPSDADRRLLDAETKSWTDEAVGLATGNSSAALELAADYAKVLNGMRDVLFTDAEDRLAPVPDDKFMVHCELHDGRCAFIVHLPPIPQLNNEDTIPRLKTIAWTLAQGVVKEHLKPGDQLAVGLRGQLDYEEVLVGVVSVEEDSRYESGDRDRLLPFFVSTVREPARPKRINGKETRIPLPRGNHLAKRQADTPVTREVIQEFPDMGWTVQSLAFSPDGLRLAAGKLDRTLLILDIETGETLSSVEKLNALSSVDQVAFSPEGQFVSAAGSTGTVMLWKMNDAGQLTDAQSLKPHEQNATCLSMNPTMSLLLTGSASGEIIRQSYSGAGPTSRMSKALPGKVLALFVSEAAGHAMATDGGDLVRIDLESSEVTTLRKFAKVAPQAAAFSPDGTKLAVASGYHIYLWDTAKGTSLGVFDGDHEMQWSVGFLPDGKRFISGGRGFATLWNMESGKAEYRFDLGGVQYIQTFAVSPDGKQLAAIPASAGQKISVLKIPQ